MSYSGNKKDGKHYWLTPPELYKKLDSEFHFDFDPCPYPVPALFNGLFMPWGKMNFVNPPFVGPTAWVRKILQEREKGNSSVLLFPIDKWLLNLISIKDIEIRNLGDVKWLSIEDNTPGPGTGRHVALFYIKP